MERSKNLIKKVKQATSGGIQASVFESEVLEEIG